MMTCLPLAVNVLGADQFGSHQAVLLDLLDHAGDKELADLALLGNMCAFGPEPGISRARHSLASVAVSSATLRLNRHVATNFFYVSRRFDQTQRSSSITWLGTRLTALIQM